MDAPRGQWLSGSRGLILARLCENPSTVSTLAARLGITPNAIRGHLARLERDGLVRYTAEPAGVGKPAHVYELTGDGESLLSRGYTVVLEALLDSAESLEPDARTRLIEGAAGVLAAGWPGRAAETLGGAEAAAEVLRELGGIAVVTMSPGGELVVEGQCCPLRAVSRRHPVACVLVETALRQALDVAVHQRCGRDGPAPTCRFVLESSSSEGRRL